MLIDLASRRMPDGSPIPTSRPIGLAATLVGPLTGLLARRYVEWRNRNFLWVTDAGYAAIAEEEATRGKTEEGE